MLAEFMSGRGPPVHVTLHLQGPTEGAVISWYRKEPVFGRRHERHGWPTPRSLRSTADHKDTQ